MTYEKEKPIAISAVKAAAQLCQQVRQEQNSLAITKADTSPVTIADFGSQAIICQAIEAAFPNDPIIAEEDATLLLMPELTDSLVQITQQVQKVIPGTTQQKVIDWINLGNGTIAERYWALDPIDGTKGFIRGDQYAIALALIEKGQIKLGVLGCPALPFNFDQSTPEIGVIFLAIRGQGTQIISLDGNKSQLIKVNSTDNIKEIRRVESVESAHSNRSLQVILDQNLGLIQPLKQMDSQAKYGAVARGEADLYLRIPVNRAATHYENIWDHAAGLIVVEEAGGKVTDLEGKSLDFSLGSKLSNNKGILVSNGKIHQRVLETIASMNDYI